MFLTRKTLVAGAGLGCLGLALLLLSGCRRADVAAEGPAPKGGGKKKGKGGRGGDGGPVPVVVTRVIAKSVPIEVTAIGNVEAYSTINLVPQIGGQLTEVYFSEGDFVKKGAKL